MLKIYVMIENFHMLSIVNQINQFFDENMKIVKIDTNIKLLESFYETSSPSQKNTSSRPL